MDMEFKIGTHRAARETDDLLAVSFGPNPTAAEMSSILDWQVETSQGKPVFLLLDFTRVETLSAETRKAVGEGTKRMNYRAVGMYGASFQIKVIAKLVNVAIALFKNHPFPQEFFNTREATLAWFEEIRRRDITGAA